MTYRNGKLTGTMTVAFLIPTGLSFARTTVQARGHHLKTCNGPAFCILQIDSAITN